MPLVEYKIITVTDIDEIIVTGFNRTRYTYEPIPFCISQLAAKYLATSDAFTHYRTPYFKTTDNGKTITNTQSIHSKNHTIYGSKCYKSTTNNIIQWAFVINGTNQKLTLGISSDQNRNIYCGFDSPTKDLLTPHYTHWEGSGGFDLTYHAGDRVLMCLDLEAHVLAFKVNDENPVIVNDNIVCGENIKYILSVQLPSLHDSITLCRTTVYRPYIAPLHPKADDATWENIHYFDTECPYCDDLKRYKDMIRFCNHFKKHFVIDNSNHNSNNSTNSEMLWKYCSKHNQQFKNGTTFIYHILSDLGVKPYHCGVLERGKPCSHSTVRADNMASHGNIHYANCVAFQPIKARKLIIVSPPSNMANWENCHNESAPCPNNNCNEILRSAADLKTHLRLCFYKINVGYVCDPEKNLNFCGKIVADVNGFIKHYHVHLESGGPYTCTVFVNDIKCGKQSTTKGKSKSHWFTHYPEKRS